VPVSITGLPDGPVEKEKRERELKNNVTRLPLNTLPIIKLYY